MQKEKIFSTNPEKATLRISINSFMMSSLFFILTLIWTLNPEKFNFFIIAQVILAIPMLFVSSLSYSKVAYWEKNLAWDWLGWITNELGNIPVLNIVGLITATLFIKLAYAYFALVILLMLTYTLINIHYRPHKSKEKLIKFVIFLTIVFFGGIYPIL